MPTRSLNYHFSVYNEHKRRIHKRVGENKRSALFSRPFSDIFMIKLFFSPSLLQGLPGFYVLISKLPHSQDRNPSITVNKYSRTKTEQVLTWPQTGHPWFTQPFEVTSSLYRCSIVAWSGSQKPWAGLSLQHFPSHLGFRTASLFMLWPSANRTSRLLRLRGGSSSVREAPTQLSHGNNLLPPTPPQGDETTWVGA